MKNKYNIFKITDHEWWIGESFNDCVKAAKVTNINVKNKTPLSYNEMTELEFYNKSDNEVDFYSFYDEYERQLKSNSCFPRLFATKNW